jgi:hypothetical protein
MPSFQNHKWMSSPKLYRYNLVQHLGSRVQLDPTSEIAEHPLPPPLQASQGALHCPDNLLPEGRRRSRSGGRALPGVFGAGPRSHWRQSTLCRVLNLTSPSEQEEVMTTKRAPVRLQKPVEGPLNRISQAYGPEPDGSAMWTPWGEQPGDTDHDVINLNSRRTVRARGRRPSALIGRVDACRDGGAVRQGKHLSCLPPL